jgi:hypothetical protein
MAIYRLYLEVHFTYNWGSGFLSDWIGPLERIRDYLIAIGCASKVVLVPQHQTAICMKRAIKKVIGG